MLRNKILTFIILLNLTLYFVIDIGELVAQKYDFTFKVWVNNVSFINTLCLLVSIVFLLIRIAKTKISKILISLMLIPIGIISFIGYVFLQESEIETYKNSEKVLATVDSSLLHTQVRFYYPVNVFLKKKTSIEQESYKGARNPYERDDNYKQFIKGKIINLDSFEDYKDFKDLIGNDAEKMFNQGFFKKDGNLYDFKDIKIEFWKYENHIKSAIIERPIVYIKGKQIIGKSINDVYKELKSIMLDNNMDTSILEFKVKNNQNKNLDINMFNNTIKIDNNGIVKSVVFE